VVSAIRRQFVKHQHLPSHIPDTRLIGSRPVGTGKARGLQTFNV